MLCVMSFHWACDVIGYYGMSFDIMSTCCRNLAQCDLLQAHGVTKNSPLIFGESLAFLVAWFWFGIWGLGFACCSWGH